MINPVGPERPEPVSNAAMSHQSCPTNVVDAPLELVWSLLTQPAGWGAFFDMRVTAVEPKGCAVAGQVIEGATGPWPINLRVRFRLTNVDAAEHQLGLDGDLPFGLKLREDIRLQRLDANRCRVSFN